MIIRKTSVNNEIKEANSVEHYEVLRVNKKTFTVKNIEYGWGCKIYKEALEKPFTDMWGTTFTYELI